MLSGPLSRFAWSRCERECVVVVWQVGSAYLTISGTQITLLGLQWQRPQLADGYGTSRCSGTGNARYGAKIVVPVDA